jgi:autotransporter strand-loop-strand O-heptosyltransferase
MEISPQALEIYDNPPRSQEMLFNENLVVSFGIKWDSIPKVEVFGKSSPLEETKFRVKMIENGTEVYNAEIHPGMFALGYKRWVCDYEIQVFDSKDQKITSWKLLDRLKESRVCVSFESSSLGDTIAWVPYVEEFRKQYGVKDLVLTTFWNQLFEGEYPEISFKYPGYRDEKMDVIIGIGWFEEEDRNIHPIDPRIVPLQKVCADILSTNYSGEIRPFIKKKIFPRPTQKKYVCFATESTAGAKYWHYPDGWQRLVNLLKKIGYEVVVIQKGSSTLNGVIDRTGQIPIEETISDLIQAEFFVGLSSGLSWLSWAVGTPTVMISGFTHPFMEFSNKTLRIINKEVCHGCFNDVQYKFDRGDWWWCPVHKGTSRSFECSRTLSPDDILIKILDWLPH